MAVNEQLAQEIEQELGEAWVPRIYRERIIKLRTRSYHFEALKPTASVTIHHTLLGVELKVGRRRMLCPDLATARYLSVFARAGCNDVAVPYDITQISRLADDLESSWQRMLLLADEVARKNGQKTSTRLRGLLFATIRSEILATGAGTRVPRVSTEHETTIIQFLKRLDVYKNHMTQDFSPIQNTPGDFGTPLPFPFNQQKYCRYEPIEKRIESARVLIVDNLLRDERDVSPVGMKEWGLAVSAQLKRERMIAGMALENIETNISRLVKQPTIQIAHVSEIAKVAGEFEPEAIVLSGTLRDFDYYQQSILDSFGEFIRLTKIPVLAICGGHQLVGLSFGARVITLDKLEQHEQRETRTQEYQYRFVRITVPSDPIFVGINSMDSESRNARILRVWQNHGLQLDRIPRGFDLLATSYLCRNQMMVKRTDDQLIYTVQFHLEKSFEDWNKSRTRWQHINDSRDGRILFENFLTLALR